MSELIDGYENLCLALQAASLSVTKLTLQVGRLLEANEELRMKLTACSVAALANTPATVQDRLTRDHVYWSPAYGDVCAAIDREIAARARAETNEQARKVAYRQSQENLTDLMDLKRELREAKAALTVARRERTALANAYGKAKAKVTAPPKVTSLPVDGLDDDSDRAEAEGRHADE